MQGLWFILFIIAMQVIAAVVQKRKKDAERKAREEMLARQAASQTGQTSSTTAGPPNSSQAELDARRKAQLEQLRQRRLGRQPTAAPPLQVPRMGSPVIVQKASRPATAVTSPSIGTSDQARTRAYQAEKRAKEIERQRREQQGRLSVQQQEIDDAAAHRAYEAGFHAVADESKELHSAGGTVRGGAAAASISSAKKPSPAAQALIQGLRDADSLRRAIVLRELLDLPIGLRGGHL